MAPPTAATLSPQLTSAFPANNFGDQRTYTTPTKIDQAVKTPAKAEKKRVDVSKLTSAFEVTQLYKGLIDTEFKQQDENPASYKYDYLRPVYPDIKEPPLKEVPYVDRGINADPKFTSLLEAVDEVEHLTPKLGTVLHGLNLSNLDDKQKDELARLIATRGMVVVRGQDHFDIQEQLALGRYWGTLHRHATTSTPKGWQEDPSLLDVHIVWGDEGRIPNAAFSQEHLWHSDVTYEVQPPSYTSLKLLQGPPTGGDTSWTSGYGIYDSLSPAMQEYLEKHEAIHSAYEQAADSVRAGKPVRREPVASRHPLVRTNPVTGHKSLFVNSGFIRSIVGVPTVESDAIIAMLNRIIATDINNSVRWKWAQGDIVFWDNRTTVHSASWGFYPHRRHAARVATVGEIPTFDKNGTSQQETIDKALGILSLDKDGSKSGNYND